MNGLSKTDADQRRQEEVGDIKNNDIFAKGKGAIGTEKEAKSNRADKKLLALKTIGKATKGKQSELLSKKGFGLVVSKVKEKSNDILKDIATTSKPSMSQSNSKSAQDCCPTPTETESSSSSEKPSVKNDPSEKSSNNFLSMLFSQYDASSDSD